MLDRLLRPFKKMFGDEFGLGPSSVNVILWLLRGCFGAIMIGLIAGPVCALWST